MCVCVCVCVRVFVCVTRPCVLTAALHPIGGDRRWAAMERELCLRRRTSHRIADHIRRCGGRERTTASSPLIVGADSCTRRMNTSSTSDGRCNMSCDSETSTAQPTKIRTCEYSARFRHCRLLLVCCGLRAHPHMHASGPGAETASVAARRAPTCWSVRASQPVSTVASE